MKFKIAKFFDSNRVAGGFCLYGQDIDTLEEFKFYPLKKFNSKLFQACTKAGDGGTIEFDTYQRGDFTNIDDKSVKIDTNAPAESDGPQTAGPAPSSPSYKPAKGDFRSRVEIIRTSALELAIAQTSNNIALGTVVKAKNSPELLLDTVLQTANEMGKYIIQGTAADPESDPSDLKSDDGQQEPAGDPPDDDIPF